MKRIRIPKWQWALLLLVLFLVITTIAYRPGRASNQHEVSLSRPSFLDVAEAAEMPGGGPIGEMLDEEAGISAWYEAPGTIDLDQVDDVFTTIELQTSSYIIGSVDVPNYPEAYDVHVYVHVDGWILVYYLQDDPVSKIIDAQAQTIDTTLLKSVASIVAGAAGQPLTDVTYYDFRYPNATDLLLVAENLLDNSGNDFTIEIPSSFAYFERSFALWDHTEIEYFRVDGTDMPRIYWDGETAYGTITAAQLSPDTSHDIQVDDYGVLVIVYRVP
jgi:hypothetical protein